MIQQLITCASSLSFVFQIYKDMQKLKNAISHCSFPLPRERKLNVTPPAVFEQWPQLKVCQRGCEGKHQVDKGVKNEYIGKALTDVNLSVGLKDHLAHSASFQQKVPFPPKTPLSRFCLFYILERQTFSLLVGIPFVSWHCCHESNLPSFSN